jgi:hypothetical protein
LGTEKKEINPPNPKTQETEKGKKTKPLECILSILIGIE